MRSTACRALTLAAALVLTSVGEAPAQNEPARAVPAVLRHEQIVVHRDAGEIDGICRSRRVVRACTDFVSERFTCECVERGGKWSIVPLLEFDIVIHTIDVRYLQHERQHILDVEQGLPKALERFTSLEMTDRAVCQNLARVISAPSFARDVMNRLRTSSNERFGCSGKDERRQRRTLIAAVNPRR